MANPMIVDVLEVVSVNEYTKKPDAHGVIETVRYVSLKCDGFMLNVRAPLTLDIPVGYSAQANIDCLPYVSSLKDRARTLFIPYELHSFIEIGKKVEKRNALDDLIKKSPAPSFSEGASSNLKK